MIRVNVKFRVVIEIFIEIHAVKCAVIKQRIRSDDIFLEVEEILFQFLPVQRQSISRVISH